MIDTSRNPSLDEAKTYIYSIDFSMVVDKIVDTKKWRRADVVKICELYRHFLFLKKKYSLDDEKLPPSEEIDEFWHNHILDTKKYKVDCQNIFGFYLDHYPYFGLDGKTTKDDLDNAFKRTQELHHKEFGDYIYYVRNVRLHHMINLTKSLFTSSKSNR